MTLMAPHDPAWARLFDALPIGAFRSTPDGRLLRANPALVRMNGYEREADLVAAVRDAAREWYVAPDRRAELIEALARDGAVSGFVSEVKRHRDGERFWVSESVAVVRAADGAPLYFEGTIEDITDRVHAQQALGQREAQLRLLGQQLPGVVYRVLVRPDGEQRFEYISPGVERIYGVTADAVMRDGGLLGRMRHPDDTAAIDAKMRAAHADQRPLAAEFRIVRPDGSARWVHALSASVGLGPEGDLRAGIILDMTERREADLLRAQRDQAESRRRATAALMSRISHELRTPLNAVLGFAQLLAADAGLNTRQREWVGHIFGSGRHLLALVDDVLDLTRGDGGELALRPSDVDLDTMVGELLAPFAGQAAAAGVTLAPPVAPLPRVRADPVRLRQVLDNLLSNAIKYNRAGGEVRLGARREGDAVGITVADTGIGLDAAQRARLFQPFDRLGAEARGVPGVGLGLALSRQLVQAMGGQIEVDSTPGAGSRFTVWLPAAGG